MTDGDGFFSRSGATNSDGKLIAEAKTMVDEKASQLIDTMAGIQGCPRAEFLREIIYNALYGQVRHVEGLRSRLGFTTARIRRDDGE